MSLVFVTGATGNVGREVVSALLARGHSVRAAVRQVDRARSPFDSRVELARLDYRDRATFDCADGADALFLLRPPAIADVANTLLPFVDRARRGGASHVVFLSVVGADRNPFIPHHAVERYLESSSGWTLLRPGFFAQNFADAYRRDVVEDARVYVPAGRGKVAFIDVRDVAAVAAEVFAAPAGHDRKAYTLTGGEAVDFASAASSLTEVVGRPIRYEPASIVGYALHLRRRALPWAQIAVQTILHAHLRIGGGEAVTDALERLLGRSPTTLRQYFVDHRALWMGQETERHCEPREVAGS